MPTADRAIPVLFGRELTQTLAFYEALGFSGVLRGAGRYAILTRGDVEIHVVLHPTLDPATSDANCYLRVADVDAWHASWRTANLPASGIPRLETVEDKPWQMREFALVDADGNLIKVGTLLP